MTHSSLLARICALFTGRTVARRVTVLAATAIGLLGFAAPAWAGTYTVDRTDDPPAGVSACTTAPNDCSLRGAIQASNTNGQTDTIGLALPGAAPHTILLGNALTVENDLPAQDLTINGPGQGLLDVKQTVSVRVLQIVGTTTVNGIAISGGRSPNDAGGILNGGVLTLNDSTLYDNWARRSQANGAGPGLGGGILNRSAARLTLNRSTVRNNSTDSGLGSGIHNEGGSMTLTDSQVRDNSSFLVSGGGGEGGGISTSSGTVTLNNSVVSGNQSFHGGGIRSQGGHVKLTDSTVTGNVSTFGGAGMLNYGTLTVDRSTVSSNNSGTGTGGIVNAGSLSLDQSTVSGNRGGGVFSSTSLAGATTIKNSTISGNTPGDTQPRGSAGLFNDKGLTMIESSTITNNVSEVPEYGGVVSAGNTSTRTEVVSTIIAHNDNNDDVNLVGGTINSFLSGGYNRIGGGDATPSFTSAGDQTNVANPGLAPLASNGGPTQTHALVPGSPAVDAGTNSVCPAVDQRGVRRPQGKTCDVGAFEVEVRNAAPVANNDAYSGREDTTLNVAAPGVLGNDTDANRDTLTATIVTRPRKGALTLRANGSLTYKPRANLNGTDSFTYRANDGKGGTDSATVSIRIAARPG